ncbi:MAG: class I SAM-dependent methyltransferase [Roseibium sp.]|uniref:class I SAM-dependent methyltransferase n=1 Tax=Roseibium sp. TaxID=1936156 RepID=UPI002602035E|nr:class I SAM-dependent methyltransferase [Roseibium sp.]MCV0429067.1 class I SAM-dependent methyltransferase [Roseibium sp.]
MAYDYDALYRKTPNALGEPNAVFFEFFKSYGKANARVLDVGCGQGRDALFIARLGHCVTGVDLSPAGVSDLLAEAARAGLAVKGYVADIVDFEPTGSFDVIVIDRTLHMLDRLPRVDVLTRLIEHLEVDGSLLIADEPCNLPDFRKVLDRGSGHWTVIKEEKGVLFARRGRGRTRLEHP